MRIWLCVWLSSARNYFELLEICNWVCRFALLTRFLSGLYFTASLRNTQQLFLILGSMHSWKEKKRKREGFVISVAWSMSKKSRRNNIRSHSLQTLRIFYSDGWDFREHPQRRAHQAIIGENSVQRKFYLTEYAIKRKILKNHEDWKKFLRSMIRNHEQWVYSSTILIYWAVTTYLRSSSSSYYSHEVGMPRNTRVNVSVPGNVFDRQHARRDPDEWHNDSRNLATSLVILRKEGIENSGSEEPLQSVLLPCF